MSTVSDKSPVLHRWLLEGVDVSLVQHDQKLLLDITDSKTEIHSKFDLGLEGNQAIAKIKNLSLTFDHPKHIAKSIPAPQNWSYFDVSWIKKAFSSFFWGSNETSTEETSLLPVVPVLFAPDIKNNEAWEKKIKFEDSKVHLAQLRNDLYWIIRCESTNLTVQLPFQKIVVSDEVSEGFLHNMARLFLADKTNYSNVESFHKKVMEQHLTSLKSACDGSPASIAKCISTINENYKSANVTLVRDEEGYRFNELEGKWSYRARLLPIVAKSQLDSCIMVSSVCYAVTLLCTDGTSFLQNHAQILIEGIEKGKYFCRAPHFGFTKKGEEKIDIPDLTHKKLEYVERSSIWVVEKEKVELMLSSIRQDQQAIESKAPQRVKHTTIVQRSDSGKTIGPYDNCFTYAMKKMELCGIQFPVHWRDKWAAMTSTHTRSCHYSGFAADFFH